MALRNRYLNDSTEEFYESNRLILRKLTNAKSELETYRSTMQHHCREGPKELRNQGNIAEL
jgi:hypothetical protein